MEQIWKEIRYAIRMLRNSPSFTLVAVITLALGIGVNTAMFSVIRAVMLKPLPYDQPENLFRLSGGSSYPDVESIRDSSKSIAGIGGYRQQWMDLTSGSVPERIKGALVTGDLFKVLGTKAQKGRLPSRSDDVPGGAKVVALSDEFWRNYRNSDPDVIGKAVSIAGRSYTVIGVLPPGFEFPYLKAMLFAPLHTESAEEAAARGAHTLRAVIRLASETKLAQAQTEFDMLSQRLAKLYPDLNSETRFVLVPWQEYLVQDVRRSLLILLAAVAFVLLIACTNVANLFLARAADREKEMAVRGALGASRASLFRQLIIEGLVLATIGGAAGVLFATWISDFAVRLGPEDIPRLDHTHLDWIVFLVTLGLSLFTGFLFSLAPGLHASKINLEESLRESGRASGGRARQKMRNIFAITEVAFAIVLLISAGLLIRSFYALRGVEPGFRTDHLLTMNFTLPLANFADIDKRTVFFNETLNHLKKMPGVSAVGATAELPFGTGNVFHNMAFEGHPVPLGKEPEVYSRSVSPDYFQVMGMKIIRGRSLLETDRKNTLLVAVANQAFVKRYYPNENPLGKRVRWAREDTPTWMTIVGVVSDVKSLGLDLEEQPAVYTPFAQESQFWKTWMNIVVRTSVPPLTLTATAQKEVAMVDKNIPVADLFTMEDLISKSVGQRRFHLALLGLFAGLALLLAGVGIYGILSYNVRQRTHEVGIRVALGASSRQIISLILEQGMRITIIGAVAGIAAAWMVTRFLQSMLYSIAPTDLFTFSVVPLIVIGVALVACYAPARRATRVHPIVALRYE
jgi:putative ABC transport system permease protein